MADSGGETAGDRSAEPGVAAVAAGDTSVQELAGHSRTVFAWTVASRLTGFLRVALIAAVLGPTYFGNLFQTANFLPYVVCQLLMASLMPAILTPHLVRLMEAGRPDCARDLACRFFGLALAAFGITAVLMGLATPLLLRLLTLAVDDPLVREAQMALGWPLILAMAPQVPLYGIATIGLAVQRAHHRFALSTAAPAFENLALVVILLVAALIFGVGSDVQAVSPLQVLFLGLGATAAVAAHAAAQWWGAYRVGVTLLPRRGWRDPELARVLRLALPSSGNAIMLAGGMLAMLVVAGGIPGGAVAFQVAYNLFNLPIALCARPIAAAQLPLLARQFASGSRQTFALFDQALRLALFVALPAALTFLVLPDYLARLITFGDMRSAEGLALVVAALGGLGLGILGESVMVVGTSAAYARHDAATPFRAMLLQFSILLLGLLVVAVAVAEAHRLIAIGLSLSLATLGAGLYLYSREVPAADRLMNRSLLRDFGGAVLAVLVAKGVGAVWPDAVAGSGLFGLVEAAAVLAVAGVVYLAFQLLVRSPQLGLLLATVRPTAKARSAGTHGAASHG